MERVTVFLAVFAHISPRQSRSHVPRRDEKRKEGARRADKCRIFLFVHHVSSFRRASIVPRFLRDHLSIETSSRQSRKRNVVGDVARLFRSKTEKMTTTTFYTKQKCNWIEGRDAKVDEVMREWMHKWEFEESGLKTESSTDSVHSKTWRSAWARSTSTEKVLHRCSPRGSRRNEKTSQNSTLSGKRFRWIDKKVKHVVALIRKPW